MLNRRGFMGALAAVAAACGWKSEAKAETVPQWMLDAPCVNAPPGMGDYVVTDMTAKQSETDPHQWIVTATYSRTDHQASTVKV